MKIKREQVFGYHLEKERRMHSLKVNEVSKDLKINKSEYLKYEKGHLIPKEEVLNQIASYYHLDTNELLKDSDSYMDIELQSRMKNKYLCLSILGGLFIIILFLLFIIEIKTTPISTRTTRFLPTKDAQLYEISDSYGTDKYEIVSSKLFGVGKAILLESNKKENVIPEEITISSGIFPNKYEVIGVNLYKLKGNITLSKNISLLLDIEDNPFQKVKNGNWDTLKVSEDNPYFDSRDNSNCIIETKTNKIVAAGTDATIPSSVTEIGSFAFFGYNRIHIPGNVKIIHPFAFCNCSFTKSIEIEEGVEEIGDFAFTSTYDNNSFISNIILPLSLKKISKYAFQSFETNLFYSGDSINTILNHTMIDEANNPYFVFDDISNNVSSGMPNFYNYKETKEEGLCWHYVNGVPTIWE